MSATPAIVLPAGYGYVFGGLFATILSNVYLVRRRPNWSAAPLPMGALRVPVARTSRVARSGNAPGCCLFVCKAAG